MPGTVVGTSIPATRRNPIMAKPTRRDRSRTRRLTGPESLEQRRVLAAVLSMQGPTDVLLEGERADFTLQLSERSARSETVFVTTRQGTATLGVDYAAANSLQVIFAPGETVKRFSINTLAEAVPRTEGRETFFVTATPVNPGLSAPLTRQVTIADAVPKPGIVVTGITVDEGYSGVTPATFTLTMSSTFPRAVTVAYATRDGSATVANDDYVAATGTVTFQPGQTSQTVTVNVNGDRFIEPDETFSLVLSAPTNATIRRGTATCTIRNDEVEVPGFQISLLFVDAGFGPVPADVQQIARDAAQRWNRVIVGDLPGVTTVTPQGTIFIDDLELTVQMGLLDDPDGTDPFALANAAPTEYRTTGAQLPYAGITGLDPADATGPFTVAARNYLLDTITHEMGHALAFGAGFLPFDPFVVGNTFTGANAVREYRQVFGNTATSVPLEPGVRGHWDEIVFNDELMSPEAEALGIREYISRVTIGALQDMGYTVNYAAAEPYVRPRTVGMVAAQATTPATTRPVVAKPVAAVNTASKAQDAKVLAVVATDWQQPATRPVAAAQFAKLAVRAGAGAAVDGSAWVRLGGALGG